MTSLPPPSNDHPIWKLLLIPLHSVQVLAWLNNQANWDEASALRGGSGESMLHWGALSDVPLLIQMLGVLDLSENQEDEQGFTPMDWQFNRQELLMSKWENKEITQMNFIKSVMQIDELSSVLWGFGGRPKQNSLENIIIFALKTGMWRFIGTLFESDLSFNRFYESKKAIHYLLYAPNTASRLAMLKEFSKGLGNPRLNEGEVPEIPYVDIQTEDGKTLLYLTVEHLLNSEVYDNQARLMDTEVFLEKLMELNPNPHVVCNKGHSAAQLVLLNSEAPEHIKSLILKNLEKIEKNSLE